MPRPATGLYRAVSSPCPGGCGTDRLHDIEEPAQPCSDQCWFAAGLRDLLRERASALTATELHRLLSDELDESREYEHPASLALYELAKSYEVKLAKYRASGDSSSALLLAGVLSDLQHVRGML